MAVTTSRVNVTIPKELHGDMDDAIERKYGKRNVRGAQSEIVTEALKKYLGGAEGGIPPEAQRQILREYDEGVKRLLDHVPGLLRGKVKRHIPDFINGIPQAAQPYKVGDLVALLKRERGI